MPGRVEYLAQIAEFVSQAARAAGFDEDTVFGIQMAVDEACANIIEHAYGPDIEGDIMLTCSLDRRGDFVVSIHDTGRSFDPRSVPDPPLGVDLEHMPEGGLGLYFMRKLTDDLHFEFDPHGGNTLTIVKRRAT